MKNKHYLLTVKEREDIPITADNWAEDVEIIGTTYVAAFIDWLLDKQDFGLSTDRMLLIKIRKELGKIK